MLTITCSANYQPERKYICHVLFHEFLGLEYNLTFYEEPFWTIQGTNGKSLILPDCLFQVALEDWLTEKSLPSEPLSFWDINREQIDCSLIDDLVPLLYGDLEFSEQYAAAVENKSEKEIVIPLDIFGSAFFMLTRYEEMVKPDRDAYDRFPASASHAFQNGYLHRPVVNEMVEILWSCLLPLAPRLERKKRQFRMKLTHDVDRPFKYRFIPCSKIFRNICGDLLVRRNLSLGFDRGRDWFCVQKGNFDKDPYYTFNLMMDLGEKRGVSNDFFFLASEDYNSEGIYNIDWPELTELMKLINSRGHTIGYHGSYFTYNNPSKIISEVNHLRQRLEELGIQDDIRGGRQHYLRWKGPLTWRGYQQAGLNYDSSLSYADHAGFRCGVCYPFPVFDLEARVLLGLFEVPLIMMECSLLSDIYMGLSYEEAYKYSVKLKEEVRKYKGGFCLLWHNSELCDEEVIRLYDSILAA